MPKRRHNKRKLSQREWAFHEVPPQEQGACLNYERVRELGVPWPPWLALDSKTKKCLVSQHAPGGAPSVVDAQEAAHLRDLLRAANEDIHDALMKSGKFAQPASVQGLALEIDWSASNEKLVDDFRMLVQSMRRDPRTLAFKYKGGKGDRGRRLGVEERLVELAVYRAKNAGYSPTEMNIDFTALFAGLHSFKSVNSRRVWRMCRHVREWLKP